VPLVALVPSAVVTETSTVPLPGGGVAVMLVGVLVVIDALLEPSFRALAAPRLTQVMVTLVPLPRGPAAGAMLVTVGTVR
jgi:hypothetical protein